MFINHYHISPITILFRQKTSQENIENAFTNVDQEIKTDLNKFNKIRNAICKFSCFILINVFKLTCDWSKTEDRI